MNSHAHTDQVHIQPSNITGPGAHTAHYANLTIGKLSHTTAEWDLCII